MLLAYLDLFCKLWVDERIKPRFFFLSFFPFTVRWYFSVSAWFAMCASMVFSFVVGVGCDIFDSDPEAPAMDEPRPLVLGEPRLACSNGCARNI